MAAVLVVALVGGEVLVVEQVIAQAKFLRRCLVEVNHHVAVGPCSHSITVDGCQEAIATWVHLLVQVGDL